MRAEIVDRDPAVTQPMRGILFTWASEKRRAQVGGRNGRYLLCSSMFYFRLTPEPALSTIEAPHGYLITRPARASTVGGSVRFKACAVLRFSTGSYLIGPSI